MGKPTIRFEGYTDDWEQRKFGDLVEKYEDPVKTPTEGYMRLGIRSHAKGTFHSYVEKGKELETAKMFRVAADKFIVNITFGWEHAVAITDEDDAGKLVSHRFPQYSFNNGILPKFFRYLILDEKFKHHLELSSPGGAGRNRVLKLSDMLEYKMNFPCEEEQRKIAVYFDDLDHLITLHQRKCEETKKLKKFMLQKMFPQKGEKVPKIRFDGFTDDWEQRKVSEIVTEKLSNGIMNNQVSNETGLRHINVINMYDTDKIHPEKLTFSGHDEEVVKKCNVEKGDIFLTRSSLKPEGIAEANVLLDSGRFVYDDHLIRLKVDKEKYDSFFVKLNLSGSDFKRQFLVRAKTTAFTTIGQEDIIECSGFFPVKEEQKKIGFYFDQLDHLITLHQRKCEELQNIKKFMLQNMFV